MLMYESERVEFKSQVPKDIAKEVIAFANTDGGTLYIGVDDRGNEIGLENVDASYTMLTNMLRDGVLPDVMQFVRCTLQDNGVIRVEVSEGSSKPYYLKDKGLRPGGVYVRQGASSVPASADAIRRMIKESDGDVYELMRSQEQQLTFDTAERVFEQSGVSFSEEKFIALGIRNLHDDCYTHLAELLSDQCRHTLKIAVFENDRRRTFKDCREIGGSLFEQLDKGFEFLHLCNHVAADFVGIRRVESPEYPDEAIRELLLNALLHRDYSYSGSIIVNVNPENMEFISIGGLLPGFSVEDVYNGVSMSRNSRLTQVFHRLHLVEAYGTGIRRIFSLYRDCPVQPEVITAPNSFKFVLPNMNAAKAPDAKTMPAAADRTPKDAPTEGLSPQMQLVLDYLSDYDEINDADLQSLLNVKRTRAYLIVREMKKRGLLTDIGRGAKKRYRRNTPAAH